MTVTEDSEQKKAMLAAIIDSSEDAIISKDLNSRITSWNKAAEKMFGYKEEEVIGKHIDILIPDDRKDEEKMIISNLQAGRRVEHFQTIRVTKTGQKIPISLTISPIKNSAGIIIGASKIARDITRQKQDEAVIKEYARRLEIINSVGRTISAQLEVSTILQQVTDATTQLSGAAFGAFFYNKTDSKGEAFMLFAISGAPAEAFSKFGMPRNTAIFKTTFDGKGILRSDDITKDPRYGKNYPHHGMPKGHLPVVSYLAVPVKSSAGIVIGGLFFGHPEPAMFNQEHEDIVAAIASQAATALDNAKLYDEIHALNNKKDEFIGFASHELKTPITTLSGYLQLAEMAPSSVTDLVPKMRKQVSRLTAIISDLLDISKIQTGSLGLNFTDTKLNDWIRESVEAVNAENHVIECEVPSKDVIVTIDHQKMTQVLVNILSNAIKYSAENTRILVTAMLLGDQVKMSIQDHGMGMAAEHLDKIFNQFYRIEKSERTEGMGIGLYISKEIVDGHSGKIWAESEEGKGSVFHVVFPIDRRR